MVTHLLRSHSTEHGAAPALLTLERCPKTPSRLARAEPGQKLRLRELRAYNPQNRTSHWIRTAKGPSRHAAERF